MENKKKYLLLVLLAVVAVGSYLVSGVYAKYTSSATGEGTATAAKWSIKLGTTEIATSAAQTVEFNLFKTVNEEDTTSTEEHVATGKIAPGTGGQVTIAIKNESEVDAEYSLTLAQTATVFPIEYSVDGNTWSSTISNVKITDAELPRGESKDIKVYWRWAFDGDDTSIGIAAQTTPQQVTVTATVTATQVD